jgi:medium-chain acyl-[acyl-carrier-protein] hydrolase
MNRTATRRVARAEGWIVGPAQQEPPAFRLFCLPYAAGSASVYGEWAGRLGPNVEVCPIELPGRQTSWRKSPFVRIEPLVDALASALEGELDMPYGIFGHSMGALVGFELARELRRRNCNGPRVLFVSGGMAPRLRRVRPRIHDQPDPVVLDRLRAMGGLAAEIWAAPELLELLLPTIRADFSVCERYTYRPGPALDCPIVSFAGSEDAEVPPAALDRWGEETTAEFTQYVLPGGHFFLASAQDALLDQVRAAVPVTG